MRSVSVLPISSAPSSPLRRDEATVRFGPAKLELKNVTLDYFSEAGATRALDAVSIYVAPGEFVAVVGPSGCGKSTLLMLVAGLLAPTCGEVLVEGASVAGPSRKVGYMLQQDTLFEWRTILDNATLGAEIQGLDPREATKRATELLTSYGLTDFLGHRPSQLSGGMRQRVALARTLVTDPSLVLLDEPFSALDAQTRLVLANEVAGVLRSAGKTVVLVTHDIGEAISMADRVVVMSARPGTITSEQRISFPSLGVARPTPLDARNTPEFGAYFKSLWLKAVDNVGD